MRYFCLLFVHVIFYSTNLLAQESDLLINETFTGVSLEEALNTLESNYDIQLAYESQIIEGVTIDEQFKEASLEKVLNSILQTTDLSFLIISPKKVMIRPEAEDTSSGETLITFKGQVVSEGEESPLPYATLSTSDGKVGVYSDQDGFFQLSIARNKLPVTLQVQHITCEMKSVELALSKNEMPFYEIVLNPITFSIDPVTVQELPPIISSTQSTGVLSIDAQQLNRLPSLIGGSDLMRQLQLLPGVAAYNDRSASLQVRASGTDENLIIVDGITLFQPDHFFGIFSALNSHAISDAKLYKNAFPAEYGGRTASVLEVKGKSNRTPVLKGRAEVNLLLANLYLAMPMQKGMNLMVSGRITNQDVTNTRLFGLISEDVTLSPRLQDINENPNRSIQKVEPQFQFYDTHIKWEWMLNASNRFMASFFHSFDDFSYQYEQTYQRFRDGELRPVTERYDEQADWKNQGWALQYAKDWTTNWTTSFQYSTSKFEVLRQVDATLGGPLLQIQPIQILSNRISNDLLSHSFALKNEIAINSHSALSFGYIFEINAANHDLDFGEVALQSVNDRQNINTLFGEYEKEWNDKFSSKLGLRTSLFSNTEYISPRLSLSYKIDDHIKLKGSASRYNQFLRQFNFEDRFARNFDIWVLSDGEEYPVAQANQFMLGSEIITNNGWSFDVELYAKQIEGVLTFVRVAPSVPTDQEMTTSPGYRLFAGQGTSIGMDWLIKKEWENYASWVAYTLSKTDHQFRAINQNQPYPSQDDRRHQLKWANVYQLENWDFSATYIFTSGRPYVDITRFEIAVDRRDVTIDEFINYLKDYHRVDIGVNYSFPLLRKKGTFHASVFNLLNRENIAYRQFIFSLPNNGPNQPQNIALGNDLQLLERTINLGFSLTF
jgi:ferric enterobactin receptor